MLRQALAATAAVCLMAGTAAAACDSTPFEDHSGPLAASLGAAGCPTPGSLNGDGAATSDTDTWDPRAPSGGEFFDSNLRRSMAFGGLEAQHFHSAFGLDGAALFRQAPQPLDAPKDGQAVYGWVSKFAGQREPASKAESAAQHHASAFRAPGGPVIQVLALLMLGAFLLRRTWGR